MIRSIILFAFILLGMASCVVGEDEYASASDFGNVVEIGDSLPRFSVTLSNGSTLSNESLKGRVAVLTFFNTACGDCRRELPLIQEAYSVYADRVSFACISRAEKRGVCRFVLAVAWIVNAIFWSSGRNGLPCFCQAYHTPNLCG